MVSNRRGSRNRRATLVAAAASVGPTAVPRTNATAQDRWPIQWAAAAVAMAVATTSNTASVPIDRASRRNPVGDDVTAASKTSSGSSPSSTTFGLQGHVGDDRDEPDDQARHHQHHGGRYAHLAQDGDSGEGDRGHDEHDEDLTGAHPPILLLLASLPGQGGTPSAGQ